MKIFFALFLTLTCFTVLAQPGRVDSTFNAPFYDVFGTGNGFSSSILNKVLEQPDGKLVVAGEFITDYNGTAKSGVVRLNPDGSLDPTFNTGTIFQASNSAFTSIEMQNDGKIIVIRENGGSTIMRRLNTDGSLDPTPIIPVTLQGSAVKALIQPDGKLLLCGNFVFQNGGPTIFYHLVRVNTDGSLDTTFLGGTGLGFTFSSSTAISELKLDAQGKILITGGFDTYNGINSKGIIRLNSDGTVDATFDSGTGFNNLVRSIAIQPDQKIILAGDFTYYKTTYVPSKIIRLNANGTFDPTFQFTELTTSTNMVNVMPDSSIIFTASYSASIPPMNNRLVRVMSNGVLDTITEGNETHGPGGGNTFSQIKLLSSGKLLLIGQFETAFNRYRGGISLMNQDFTLDNSFNPKPGFRDEIEQVFVQPDGKIYATKEILAESVINVYNDVIVKGLVRINGDGSLDTTFHIPDSLLVSAEAVVVQPDAKVVVAGMTKIYDGSNWVYNRNVVRFNPDGSLDQSFATVPLVAQNLDKLLLQTDGKIIILGVLSVDNGNTYPHICRLNPNGTLDNSFNVGSGANNRITTGLITSSGKIIIGGDFTSFNGIPAQRLAAINPNGSLDLTFAFNGNIGSMVKALEKQADGKMYLTAEDLADNNNYGKEILRLNPDGSIDPSFDAFALNPFSSGQVLHALRPLPDGKLLVGGSMYEFDNQPASGIVLVNADGSRDTTFYSTYAMGDPNVVVKSIALGLGGKIVIGGEFSKVAGKPSNNIAVLNSDLADYFEVSFTDVSNVGCAGNGSATATVSGGFPPYQYSWTNSSDPSNPVQIISTGGIYTCIVTDSLGFVDSASVLIDSPAYPAGFDLKSNLLASSFRSGFDNTIVLNTVNDGCAPVSGQLICVLDPMVQFNSSIPAPDYSNNDTLIWDFSNLMYDSGGFLPVIYTTVSAAAQIGDSITIDISVTPVSNDSDTLNNSRRYSYPVINGYDPNVKSVYPVGKCDEAYVENGQKFTYTVEFQNTGNAEAINIVVVDSLDENLDLNTLHIVGNSHPVWIEAAEGNTVKFHFDSINLPDSTFNEEASHGHVVFEIDPISDSLSNNTIISNKAEIYFDFNPAIVTNTCSNTIYDGDLDNLVCDPGLIPVDSVIVTTMSGGAAQITTSAGTLQLQSVVYPLTADQSVAWSIVPVTGSAAISANGLVTASGNGTVWAKALSMQNAVKADSILITITNQDLGIDALNESGFAVYPNPTNNKVTISTNSKQEEMMRVVITDLSGKEVIKEINILDGNLELNLISLERGTYILIIRGSSGELVKRIVKI